MEIFWNFVCVEGKINSGSRRLSVLLPNLIFNLFLCLGFYFNFSRTFCIFGYSPSTTHFFWLYYQLDFLVFTPFSNCSLGIAPFFSSLFCTHIFHIFLYLIVSLDVFDYLLLILVNLSSDFSTFFFLSNYISLLSVYYYFFYYWMSIFFLFVPFTFKVVDFPLANVVDFLIKLYFSCCRYR